MALATPAPPSAEAAGGTDEGQAYVFSGADGSLLFSLTAPNPQVEAYFGRWVAVGDVNGDGRGDIVVGAYREDVATHSDQGRAYVFSGADGSLLFSLTTPNPETMAFFGVSVTVGDVNGDGKGDIAVAAFREDVAAHTDQGRAYVFSGADGTLLLSLTTPNSQTDAYFGRSVAVGDVNGDGKGDIAVSGYREDVAGDINQGRVYVFSGADGSLLFSLTTPSLRAEAYFGRWVAMGDVNGDGKADIAAGAFREHVAGNPDQGRAYVFSGADGSPLFVLDTPNPQAQGNFGYWLAVEDVNGDGKGDIAVGAWAEEVTGNADQGRAYVFSGADGSLLYALNTPNPQADAFFGASVAAGDVDGDGKADVAVSAFREDVAGHTSQGRVHVFSGADGSLLFSVTGPNPEADVYFGPSTVVGPYFGRSVAVGDVDGDGKADIAVGAPFQDVGPQ